MSSLLHILRPHSVAPRTPGLDRHRGPHHHTSKTRAKAEVKDRRGGAVRCLVGNCRHLQTRQPKCLAPGGHEWILKRPGLLVCACVYGVLFVLVFDACHMPFCRTLTHSHSHSHSHSLSFSHSLTLSLSLSLSLSRGLVVFYALPAGASIPLRSDRGPAQLT